jgi:hypothetical protein
MLCCAVLCTSALPLDTPAHWQDKNLGDKAAEEKFKAIASAYEVRTHTRHQHPAPAALAQPEYSHVCF